MNNPDYTDCDDRAEVEAAILRWKSASPEQMALIIDPRVMARAMKTNVSLKDEIVIRESHERLWKFRKVYKAPGYPVDPQLEKSRALDAYVNAFSPQPHGTFDRELLKNWLNNNIN